VHLGSACSGFWLSPAYGLARPGLAAHARSRGASADSAGRWRPVDSGYPAAWEGGETDQEQIGVEGGPILGSKGGSPHQSWAVHGGRAGECDGDNVACRLRVVVDGS
jgi:hypothetical protein